MRFFRCVALAVSLFAGKAFAQSAVYGSETDLCLGFSFGSWKPALNLVEAGHRATVDTTHFPKAPGGRDWATSGTKAEGDSTFLLFPIWWPAGVIVSLERVPRTVGDTVRGQANALVADARKESPMSVIHAWQKACHG